MSPIRAAVAIPAAARWTDRQAEAVQFAILNMVALFGMENDNGDVFRAWTRGAGNPKRGSKISVSDGVVAKWAGWQAVASTGGWGGAVGVSSSPEISLLGSGAGEKLVEDGVGLFFMG